MSSAAFAGRGSTSLLRNYQGLLFFQIYIVYWNERERFISMNFPFGIEYWAFDLSAVSYKIAPVVGWLVS